MQAGYKQAGDKAGERWAQDELVQLLPKSAAARRVIQSRFYEEHPYPKGEASEADRQAYYRAVVQTTSEWLKRWPEDESTLSYRLNSLMSLKGVANSEVETTYNAYAKAHERSGVSYSIPPLELSVARYYLKYDFRIANVPGLILKGLAEIEKIEKSAGESDLYPRPPGDYWRAAGKVAEIQQRKLDALTAYQTALVLNPPRAEKDELADV